MPDMSVEGQRNRVRALVHGRVQGVLFRDFTREQAWGLGLVGWVRNLSNGTTVEVVAEGSRAALEELAARLRLGPPGAHVVDIDLEWNAATGEFDAFRVS